MNKVRSKFDLARCLFGQYPLRHEFTDSQGKTHIGTLATVQREDGSGHSFNVTLDDGNTFHMRTVD